MHHVTGVNKFTIGTFVVNAFPSLPVMVLRIGYGAYRNYSTVYNELTFIYTYQSESTFVPHSSNSKQKTKARRSLLSSAQVRFSIMI